MNRKRSVQMGDVANAIKSLITAQQKATIQSMINSEDWHNEFSDIDEDSESKSTETDSSNDLEGEEFFIEQKDFNAKL